jgi:hypothetical protein
VDLMEYVLDDRERTDRPAPRVRFSRRHRSIPTASRRKEAQCIQRGTQIMNLVITDTKAGDSHELLA